MKKKYLIAVGLLLHISFLIGCTENKGNQNPHKVRSDVRFGSKFYSLCVNEAGESYAIRGTCSDYAQPFVITSSDSSGPFTLDSVRGFFKRVENLKEKPIINTRNTDAPRIEIYYDEKKVYDTRRWDDTFWDIFRPIITQIPRGFNPFILDDKPFG